MLTRFPICVVALPPTRQSRAPHLDRDVEECEDALVVEHLGDRREVLEHVWRVRHAYAGAARTVTCRLERIVGRQTAVAQHAREGWMEKESGAEGAEGAEGGSGGGAERRERRGSGGREGAERRDAGRDCDGSSGACDWPRDTVRAIGHVPRRSMQPSGMSGSSERSSAPMSVPMSRPYAPVSSDVSHTWQPTHTWRAARDAHVACNIQHVPKRTRPSLVLSLTRTHSHLRACTHTALAEARARTHTALAHTHSLAKARARTHTHARARTHRVLAHIWRAFLFRGFMIVSWVSRCLLHALVGQHRRDAPGYLGGLIRPKLAALNAKPNQQPR